MSGIDDARGEVRAGFVAAMQGATLLAGLLNSGGREGRDAAGFFARQARDQELHQNRLQTEVEKRAQQRESHELTVENRKEQIANTIAENDRKAILDGFRGVEIVQKIDANSRLGQARVKEVDERIAHNADENQRKADLDKLREAEIRDRTDNSRRESNAKVDHSREQQRIARADRRRRNRESGNRERRENELHDSRLQSPRDRARWGEAKHKAEMAEIYQRMEDRARRSGLSEQLATSQSATTAGMRSAAAFAAANSTRDWGDSEAQNAADFAEMAAQDGVTPEDLVAFVRSAPNNAVDPAVGSPPEQQLAENLVTQIHDAHVNAVSESPLTGSEQSRETLEAAGLTAVVDTDVRSEPDDPAPSVEPAQTPAPDVGLD